VWPIEEQPVPASNVPGERASRTQPFPTRPAPFDIQGVRDEDLIDLTPQLRKEAQEIVSSYDHGPLFTPPSLRGTIEVPGNVGGASWAGAAIDPETGMFYVGTVRLPVVITLRKPDPNQSSYDFIGLIRYLRGPRGLPLLKPPFGSIVAIDMNSGEHRWRVPAGRSESLPRFQRPGIPEEGVGLPLLRQLGLPDKGMGLPFRSWALVTRTVLIVVQMGYHGPSRLLPKSVVPIMDLNNLDPHLWVYDKTSGEMLAEIPLPANAAGAPITYMTGGKQYIAFPVGGGPLAEELIAVSL
jgi:quinoprotein glucose dehydrogenase